MRSNASLPGEIRDDASYTAEEFRRRCGLRDFAWREVRRLGLRVICVGRKRYVLGRDWLDLLDKIAAGSITTPEN